MKILFYILALFSQAFAVVIVQSNIKQTFDIDSVEGVGYVEVPEEFRGMLKLKLKDHYAHGKKIKKKFYKYIESALEDLNDSEKSHIHDLLIGKDWDCGSSLIAFEDLSSFVKQNRRII